MNQAEGSSHPTPGETAQTKFKVRSDLPFILGLCLLGGFYVVMILLMVLADLHYTDASSLKQILGKREIQFSIKLSLISCTLSTLFSLWISVPIGYLMSRFQFRFKSVVDTILDIPIVLPPLVVGLSLLILFNYAPFKWLSKWVVFEMPAVILAQFMVACAFAVRTMRVTFDQIPERYEQVAMTLGCNRSQAFWKVIFPQAKRGLLAAGTLAWARSLGEFGPILVFAGSTSMRTEVLPTSVYLEMQSGNLKGMLSVSIVMILLSAVVLIMARLFGMQRINA
ncbi:MAG: ABC transporter permease [Verrucomicrobia bacterium]|jgi:molybdate transport system permease protein|nr:ABC transporter permease [Verrucomicrobiota bacterium]